MCHVFFDVSSQILMNAAIIMVDVKEYVTIPMADTPVHVQQERNYTSMTGHVFVSDCCYYVIKVIHFIEGEVVFAYCWLYLLYVLG